MTGLSGFEIQATGRTGFEICPLKAEKLPPSARQWTSDPYLKTRQYPRSEARELPLALPALAINNL